MGLSPSAMLLRDASETGGECGDARLWPSLAQSLNRRDFWAGTFPLLFLGPMVTLPLTEGISVRQATVN
jgi:hypothetical protein